MPNYCNFDMHIKGKKENIQHFLNILQTDYNYEDDRVEISCEEQRHMFRIFDTYVETDMDDFEPGESAYADVSGECAWSVVSCMCEGDHTYYNDMKKNKNFKGTTLQKESETYGLVIEVFSSESGCAFQEHFLYSNGYAVIEDCVGWHENYYDDDEEEYVIEKGGFPLYRDFTCLSNDMKNFLRMMGEWPEGVY